MANYPRGSEWRRWDLHIHTPETLLNNQYEGNDWKQFIKKINESSVDVIGITDYMLLDNYKKLYQRKEELSQNKYIIPNLEFRMTPETKDGKGINLHLIINPEDHEHIEKIEKALSHLCEEYRDHKYYCTAESLQELGNGSLTEGGKQFKVSIATFKKWYNDEKWLKQNSIIAVANSNHDGVSGLKDSGFLEQKKDFYYLADVVFSSNPKDVVYFLGKGVDSKEKVIDEYRSIKPCIHGSDAHDFEKMFNPDGNRFCWIKADPTFLGLKQAILEPDRVFIGEIPPALDRINKNKTKILDSLHITQEPGYNEANGVWFKDVNIEFNPEMTAIIGNKGSGKTAIAEITALLCDSKSEQDFVFLNDKKFRLKGLANNFTANLNWLADSIRNSKNLNSHIDSNSEEKIHFVPQRSFEKYCNDSDEDFVSEINNVVFSRMKQEDRLGFESFKELEKHRKYPIEEQKRELFSKIKDINKEVKELELKRDCNYKDEKQKSLSNLLKEIEEHQKIKPSEIPAPPEVSNPTFTKLQKQYNEIEEKIVNLREEKNEIKRILSELENLKASIKSFETSIQEHCDSFQEKLSHYELNISSIFSYKFDFGCLESKINEKQKRIKEIEDQIKIDSELQNCGQLVIIQNELKKQIDEFNKDNLGKLTQYQAYQKNKKEWDEKNNNLLEKQKSLQQELIYLGDLVNSPLIDDIKKKRDERLQITKKIFNCLTQEVSIYDGFKNEIENFIKKYEENMGKYNVSIESGIFIQSDFAKKFIDYISNNINGPFKGDEGYRKIKEYVENASVDRWDGVLDLINKIQHEFDTFENTNGHKIYHNMFKKDMFDIFSEKLYGLSFLDARYSLRLYNKPLYELSPGERGSLLLVFYLLLDARDIPLILDQPEDNLDNESVAKILVPFIKEAKKRRQIIIITHNSNLAVVSDAEQVIRVKIDKKNNNTFSFESGSLESNIITDVINVLEGTRASFNIRNNKYEIIGE